MQIGIVGLPYSGKSTLFQAVTKTHLDPASLAKSEAHHAVVKVPDARLDRCAELFSPPSTVHATIEFVDVVGLKKGESGSTQFTTNFLSNVKNNDALVQVVRAFRNDAVPHPDGSIDPVRDVTTFDTEFILADLAVLETRIERLRKQVAKAVDDAAKKELPILERCHAILEGERPLRDAGLSREETNLLKTYQLLSLKPMLIAVNCDDKQVREAPELHVRVAEAKEGSQTKVMTLFGKIDLEISELDEEEARSFMAEYGIAESALSTLIRESYALLGLQSFLTVGEDECRAWTIRRGMTAQEAAGVIHSDFFAKFIRAEVVGYDEFMKFNGSFAKAKEAGVWRLEGKEYVVKDGDVMSIRHS
jgi:GTP-binding protein YchF